MTEGVGRIEGEPSGEELQPGVYRHVEGGLYQVEAVIEDATGYEQGRPLEPSVLYVQLEDGETRQAGARYTRALSDFRGQFERVEQQ